MLFDISKNCGNVPNITCKLSTQSVKHCTVLILVIQSFIHFALMLCSYKFYEGDDPGPCSDKRMMDVCVCFLSMAIKEYSQSVKNTHCREFIK